MTLSYFLCGQKSSACRYSSVCLHCHTSFSLCICSLLQGHRGFPIG